ncbi:Tripartite tricarboxylate transporter TctB family protein [Marinovum algicola]|uniref:Tripartite tricarboxylate transporter TctB family protein n=1 Tax=Marinovum algicola TaxID=42444 RepID=A0A975WFI2_9RHOB|nr:tripartite tricarboxylate transporter TctB family protein [Marinovum algicola]SEK11106.1 Tripartite tricarboxylate transporter TctB family protein [Marinovum algicola]SLN71112.1 Tripartite tricarboxylate transporter TctB family protein [Marinovum algicola]
MVSSRTLNIAALGFLFAVIVTVFWQIETTFKEQGIASGGPYDNAAAYPRTIAILIGALLVVQLVTELLRRGDRAPAKDIARSDLRRAGLMLAVFAVYLGGLTTVGYHLATAPLIFAIMWICGMRNVLKLALAAIGIATGFAFLFEVFLNVVLPLGIWDIFIPW